MDEHLQCPICFENPTGEIYQCVNGHTICSNCIKDMKTCPQCRIPYGPTKIRNRALEQILHRRTFSCIFKKGGCQQKHNMENLYRHISNCDYNPSSKTAGRVCQLIGFNDCKCFPRSSDRTEIIKHFRDDHEFPVQTGNSLNIQHGEFVAAATSNRMWQPVLVCMDNKPGCGQGPLILILGKIDINTNSACWLGVCIWETVTHPAKEYRIQFTLQQNGNGSRAIQSEQSDPISWTMPIVSLDKAEKAVWNSCPISICLSDIKNYFMDAEGDASMLVSFKPRLHNERGGKKVSVFSRQI